MDYRQNQYSNMPEEPHERGANHIDFERDDYSRQSSMPNNSGKSLANKPRDIVIFVAYLIVFALLSVADYFYQDPLFEVNLKYVPGWQDAMSDASVKFFEIITLFGYAAVGIGFFFLFYTFSTREKAFYFLLVQTSESLLNQLAKLIYHNSRPYFYTERGMKIYGSCAMTYGNPSGQAMFSASIYITLFLLIFHDRDYRIEERVVMRLSINQGSGSVVIDQKSKNQFRLFQLTKNPWVYALGVLFTAFMMFGIGISRFMLGAHSIDQVIYGWS